MRITVTVCRLAAEDMCIFDSRLADHEDFSPLNRAAACGDDLVLDL